MISPKVQIPPSQMTRYRRQKSQEATTCHQFYWDRNTRLVNMTDLHRCLIGILVCAIGVALLVWSVTPEVLVENVVMFITELGRPVIGYLSVFIIAGGGIYAIAMWQDYRNPDYDDEGNYIGDCNCE